MPRRHELPTDPSTLANYLDAPHKRATSEPEDVKVSHAAWIEVDAYPPDAELRELLVDAFDTLSERERFVCDAILFERQSLSQVAERISYSKTHTKRIKDNAMKKLRAKLEGHPMLEGRVK